MSFFNDRNTTILVIAALVDKLGGRVTINQADIDRVSYNHLVEEWTENDELVLEFNQRKAAK